MIQTSHVADERRKGSSTECWLLHGAVGLASDWRPLATRLAECGIGSRAIDLWRFLDCCAMPIEDFGRHLNAEASGCHPSIRTRILVGYSMGGRLALHALLQNPQPWSAAILISAHPGLEYSQENITRRASDAEWASRALHGPWDSFLNQWNRQPVLAGANIHSARDHSRLAQRRRQIARSFIDWSLGSQGNLWPRLAEIQIPVLWIAGASDVPAVQRAQRAASLMHASDLRIAPNAGHRVPWQSESWLFGQIMDFLNNPARGCQRPEGGEQPICETTPVIRIPP